MRRFACKNFQITTTADSKLSYTPCYALVAVIFFAKLQSKHKKNFYSFVRWQNNYIDYQSFRK